MLKNVDLPACLERVKKARPFLAFVLAIVVAAVVAIVDDPNGDRLVPVVLLFGAFIAWLGKPSASA